MKILNVLSPVLHEVARPVRDDEFGEELGAYMDEMLAAMKAAKGVGLAAPQVGDGRRLVVVSDGNVSIKMVNPRVLSQSEEVEQRREGCLSVPRKGISVERPACVEVAWSGPCGLVYIQHFTGFAATVVQHEIDHLDGVTLLDRMSPSARKRYLGKLKRGHR